jgi:hypothetical protein
MATDSERTVCAARLNFTDIYKIDGAMRYAMCYALRSAALKTRTYTDAMSSEI